MMQIECPCCGRDWVHRVFIGATDRNVFLCYECESVWFDLLSIDETTFVPLDVYLTRCRLDLGARTYRTFKDDTAFMKVVSKRPKKRRVPLIPSQMVGPGKGPRQLAR